jgi:hypothetical protein
MIQFNHTKSDKIEIVLSDVLSRAEFQSLADRLELLSSGNDHINIVFDTRELKDHYSFKIFLDEQNLLRKQKDKSHFDRVAFVSDDDSEVFLLEQFVKSEDPEFMTSNQIEEARRWIAH